MVAKGGYGAEERVVIGFLVDANPFVAIIVVVCFECSGICIRDDI